MNDLQHKLDNGLTIVDRYLDAVAIECLIEEIAALQLAPERAGHRNILALSPMVERLAHSLEIHALVDPILGANARVVSGILFDKQPTANWKVRWHQDLTIAVNQRLELPDYQPWSLKDGIQHVQPPVAILEQMLAVRIHLDRTDATNGALRVIPGSHRDGKLTQLEIDRWKQSGEITCACDAGSILLMRPLLLHASSAALVPSHRRVIHLEYAGCDLPAGLDWYYRSLRSE